jgi:PAS domain S-box-containing protein
VKKTRILIVEDEGIVAKDLAHTLERLGYGVIGIVSSGEQAIDEAAGSQPDLVLMDIKLNGAVDGIEAAEQIRIRLDVPVVYLTAYADERTLQRAKVTEPFGYVLKPFQKTELRSAIEMALYRHEMERRLKESERRFRSLIENASDVITLLDGDRTIRYISPAVDKVLGYEPESLVDRDMLDFLHPHDAARIKRVMAEASREPSVFHLGEARFRHKDGSWRWLDSIGNNQLDTAAVKGIVVNCRDVTARKRAEEAQRASERELTLTLDATTDGIWKWDLKSNELSFSPRYYTMLGYEPDEFPADYETWASLIHPDDLQDALAVAARCFSTGPDDYENEFRLRSKSGDYRWIRAEGRVVKRDEQGNAARLIGNHRDITERKLAEKGLRRYARRLETLHEIDQAVLAARSPHKTAQVALHHVGQLVPCVGAGLALFDSGAQEAVLLAVRGDGAASFETGTHMSLEEVVEVERLRQGEVVAEEDLLAQTKPPPAIQALQAAGIRSYVVAPLIARGELSGALGLGSESPGAFIAEHVDIVREVADEVAVALHLARVSAELETERRRLETTVQHVPAGILLLDAERRILLANPTAQQHLPILTDCSPGDVLTRLADRPLDQLLVPPRERMWHEIEVPGPPHRVFEVLAWPLAEDERHSAGWVLTVRDVTEERKAREYVHRQERLAAVGQLAGGIAHDFRNFLSTILLYADMALCSPDLPSCLASPMETIVSESRRASELAQRILDFGRRSMLKTQPLDLRPFVKETLRVLERAIPESICVYLEPGAAECVVEADPTRIQQVLMNLALNARDAMPEGGDLRMSLTRAVVTPERAPPVVDMTPGDWVCLAVSDTGIGMTEEVQAHLFEPFFTTKNPGAGTGLGLAQVYGIVQEHQGHIDVETEMGMGTTLRVYLPACGGVRVEEHTEVGSTPRGRGETILLVEDEGRVREAVG